MQKQMKKSFTELFNQSPELLTREQAAEYLGITPRTLAVWACVKRYNFRM